MIQKIEAKFIEFVRALSELRDLSKLPVSEDGRRIFDEVAVITDKAQKLWAELLASGYGR